MRLLIPIVLLALSGAAEAQVRTSADGTLQLQVSEAVQIPAGTVYVSEDGKGKCVLLDEVNIQPEAGKPQTLPLTTLSLTDGRVPEQSWKISSERVEALEPLIRYLSSHRAVSAATRQLAALCLLRNVDAGQWHAEITDQDLYTIVAALDLLHQITPERTFALQQNSQLKLRALHLSDLRPKAMQVYGIALPPAAFDPQSLPNMRQLMHTPGDNCPICRQRAAAERLQDNL